MSAFDKIVEQQVNEGRERGLFDDLPGHGKPLPDLDRPRRQGWWAERFVKRERDTMRRDDLTADIAAAMPALWRSPSEAQVVERVDQLNERIRAFNQRRPAEPVAELAHDDMIARWRELAEWR